MKSMDAGHYRLTNPTLALVLEDGRHVAYTVETGTVILITDEAFNGNSLVNAIWDGKTVMMFAEDLRVRTARVAASKKGRI
jgi:hypothetical protein